jgi:hypothetical protein
LFPARQSSVAATASLLIAGACFTGLFSGTAARAQGTSGCEEAAGIAVLASPAAPWTGAPLRVIFTAEKPLAGSFTLTAPDGHVAAASREQHGGPPYFWFAEVASPAAGTWRATLSSDRAPAGCSNVTHDIAVRGDRPPRPHATAGSVWPVHNSWNRATEDLYSAWIEKLFDAAPDAAPSWPALHEVLRDRARNVLFDYLGLGEDEMKMVIRPDCADLPYFLRAYFAFKMGLPFGYSKCSRGGHGKAPTCFAWLNNQNSGPKGSALAAVFGQFLQRNLADTVHSGTGRTALADNNTDYYPVPLSQQTLRPGTVYADPYGHILVLVKRVPQTRGGAGVFFAVDGQPDGTVGVKRFWRGNFLFAKDPGLGGPGFKRFRPIVREKNGSLRRLTNAEIAKDSQYGDFSLEQGRLSVEGFYDRMDDVMSPAPLDPLRAMQEAITSLDEQVKVRVTSVENGRKYQNKGRSSVDMPNGATIFETTGAWEDFSTPSRDLRLLIAMDVVRTFPDRVARRPERYAMPEERSVAQVKAQLQGVLASELAARKFSYPRSDGSMWTLSLKNVFDRAAVLEMAYNPNDCVELRWGAPAGSAEASTCKRHAPSAQRAKMASYRPWFHERRRPPRP